MLNFLKRHSKKYHVLVLDIGTEFVKCLIVRVDDRDHGTVIGFGRQRQKYSDMAAGAVTDIPGVIKNCEEAIQKAYDQAGIFPKQVIAGIAGELVKGATTTITHTRKQPRQKITESELRDMIAHVQAQALEESRKDLAWETGHSAIDVKLVNSAIVNVRIDGYRITNPIGFQGTHVDVSIYNSFAPIVHLGAIQTIIESLELHLLQVAAEPYAVSRCLGTEASTDLSGIFIDIGGGTTDIAVVRSGGLEGTKMFALGGRVFTKRIADELKVSFQEAEKLKLEYTAEKLESEKRDKIAAIVARDIEVWLSGVELTLEEFSQGKRFEDNKLLPPQIYLCGGGSKLPEIQAALKTNNWAKELPFSRHPDIDTLHPNKIVTLTDETKKLIDEAAITPMALGNLGIELTGAESVLDSVMEKVMASLTV